MGEGAFDQTVRWSSSQLDEMRAEITNILLDKLKEEDPQEIVLWAISQVEGMDSAGEPEDELRRFVFAISTLRLHEEFGGLSSSQISKLTDLANAILRTNFIAPSTSNLSILYGELYLALSQIRRKEGRHWQATWLHQMAHVYSKRSPTGGLGFMALSTGIRALRQGDAALTLESIDRAIDMGIDPHFQEQCFITRVQALRLSARYPECERQIFEIEQIVKWSQAGRLELEWEKYCLQAQRQCDLNPMIKAIGRNGTHRYSTYQLESTLWARAITTKKWMDRIPKIETIRRAFPESLKKPQANAGFYEICLLLERCYDNEIPLLARLEKLGAGLETCDELMTVDKELLVLASSARWLVRARQYMFGTLVLNRYRSLSSRLTNGVTTDLLGVFSDLEEKPWHLYERNEKRSTHLGIKPVKEIKVSRALRTASFSKLALDMAFVKMRSRLKRISADQTRNDEIKADETYQIARLACDALSDLKGPIMKLGQLFSTIMISHDEDIIHELSTLEQHSTPFDEGKIREVVENELGQPVEKLFKSWSKTPLASASIGQIHRAVTNEGDNVIVKVQYPGIKQVVEADLRSTFLVSPIYKLVFPGADIDGAMNETNRLIRLECDYKHEASMQELARKTIGHIDGLKIPKIYTDLCTEEVLVMEFIDGVGLRDFAATASQEDRDRVGAVIFEGLLEGFFSSGFSNGDPHPGNFIITNDLEVALIDFGFSSQIDNALRLKVLDFMDAALEKDYYRFKDAILNIGIVSDESKFNMKRAFDNMGNFVSYGGINSKETFSREWLLKMVQNSTVQSVNRKYMTLPVELSVVARMFVCLQPVLTLLSPRANWGDIIHAVVKRNLKKANDQEEAS